MSSLRWCVALLAICVGFAAGEIKNKGWWRNSVFYQVYPRSFMDANDDGIGDLKGITSKLQHFKDTGIGAIWLSPIYASPMIDFGYDISDFRDIDPGFGTMADLEELTAEAKKLGIKVIMDLVPNHTSDKHEWFIKSFNGMGKYKDYYVWRTGKNNNAEPPNNWISVFSGSAWTFNATRGLWYFHQFEYRQPDLNYSNPNVRQEMEEIIKFWLGKGIDGFRVDAIPHVYERDDLPDEPRTMDPTATEKDYKYLNHIYTKDDPRTYDLIASWRKIVDEWSDSHNEDEKVILTEAYTSLENTTKFYDFGSHVPFNFDFIMRCNVSSKPDQYKQIIEDWISHTPSGGVPNWVMGNHDRSRTATRYPGRADQMTMLSMILPGIAVTYNGEEIGMVDKLDITWDDTQDPQACNTDPNRYKSFSRDPNRTPFQWDGTKNAGFSKSDHTWLPVHENYETLNLKKQKSDPASHYGIYKDLVKLRSTSNALQNGTLKVEILNDQKVLAIVRQAEKETVVLLINFSDDQSQQVKISSYTGNAENATILTASVGSTVTRGATLKIADNIPLQAKASIVLKSVSGAFSITPAKFVLLAMYILSKFM